MTFNGKKLTEGIGRYTGTHFPPTATSLDTASRRSEELGSGALRHMLLFTPHIREMGNKIVHHVSSYRGNPVDQDTHHAFTSRFTDALFNLNSAAVNRKLNSYIGHITIHDPVIHGNVKHRVHFYGYEPHEEPQHAESGGFANIASRLNPDERKPSRYFTTSYDEHGTEIRHHFVAINKAYIRSDAHNPSRLHTINSLIAHELGHVSQELDQPTGAYLGSGSTSKGTHLLTGAVPHHIGMENLELDKHTAKMRREIARRIPRVAYTNSGVELNARVYGLMPHLHNTIKDIHDPKYSNIRDVISRSHAEWGGIESKLKQRNVNPEQIEIRRKKHYVDLHKRITSDFLSKHGRRIAADPALTDSYLQHWSNQVNTNAKNDRTGGNSLYSARMNKLLKKQKRNVLLLADAMNQHHLGSEIKNITGFDVNATREAIQSFSPSHHVKNKYFLGASAERKITNKRTKNAAKLADLQKQSTDALKSYHNRRLEYLRSDPNLSVDEVDRHTHQMRVDIARFHHKLGIEALKLTHPEKIVKQYEQGMHPSQLPTEAYTSTVGHYYGTGTGEHHWFHPMRIYHGDIAHPEIPKINTEPSAERAKINQDEYDHHTQMMGFAVERLHDDLKRSGDDNFYSTVAEHAKTFRRRLHDRHLEKHGHTEEGILEARKFLFGEHPTQQIGGEHAWTNPANLYNLGKHNIPKPKPEPIVASTQSPETQTSQKQPLGKRILSKVKSIFQKKQELNETIVKSGSEYCVRSKKGKNLGCSPSRAGAVKRLRQVEYFKHMKESLIFESKDLERRWVPLRGKELHREFDHRGGEIASQIKPHTEGGVKKWPHPMIEAGMKFLHANPNVLLGELKKPREVWTKDRIREEGVHNTDATISWDEAKQNIEPKKVARAEKNKAGVQTSPTMLRVTDKKGNSHHWLIGGNTRLSAMDENDSALVHVIDVTKHLRD